MVNTSPAVNNSNKADCGAYCGSRIALIVSLVVIAIIGLAISIFSAAITLQIGSMYSLGISALAPTVLYSIIGTGVLITVVSLSLVAIVAAIGKRKKKESSEVSMTASSYNSEFVKPTNSATVEKPNKVFPANELSKEDRIKAEMALDDTLREVVTLSTRQLRKVGLRVEVRRLLQQARFKLNALTKDFKILKLEELISRTLEIEKLLSSYISGLKRELIDQNQSVSDLINAATLINQNLALLRESLQTKERAGILTTVQKMDVHPLDVSLMEAMLEIAAERAEKGKQQTPDVDKSSEVKNPTRDFEDDDLL